MLRRPLLSLVFAALFVTGCGGSQSSSSPGGDEAGDAVVEPSAVVTIAEFDRMASGIGVWDERIFVSFPRWVEDGDYTVAELVDGRVVPIPVDQDGDEPSDLISVNGLHVDELGRLWILDNARVNLAPAMEGAPKLVVWDIATGEELFRHVFSPETAPAAGSFLNDIAVSVNEGFAYITETGMGGTPALIVYDIARDQARRVLDGHEALLPEADAMTTVLGEDILIRRPDGDIPWRVGANAIALDEANGRLLFGPMTGTELFAIPTLALRNPELDDVALSAALSVVAEKPLTDGIAATADEVFMTSLGDGAVVSYGLGDAGEGDDALERLSSLTTGLSFPVALEPTEDGVYVTESQFHRMPLLRGEDLRQPPFRLLFIPVP